MSNKSIIILSFLVVLGTIALLLLYGAVEFFGYTFPYLAGKDFALVLGALMLIITFALIINRFVLNKESKIAYVIPLFCSLGFFNVYFDNQILIAGIIILSVVILIEYVFRLLAYNLSGVVQAKKEERRLKKEQKEAEKAEKKAAKEALLQAEQKAKEGNLLDKLAEEQGTKSETDKLNKETAIEAEAKSSFEPTLEPESSGSDADSISVSLDKAFDGETETTEKPKKKWLSFLKKD